MKMRYPRIGLLVFAFAALACCSCFAEETGEDIVEEKYEKVFEIEAYISKDACLLAEDFVVYSKLKQIETEGGDKRSISMLSKFDLAKRETVWSVETEGGRPLSSNKDSIITFGGINLRGTRTSPWWDAQVKAINPGNGETIWEYLEKEIRGAGPVGGGKSHIALPVCPPWKKGESPSPVLIVIDIAEGNKVKRIDLKGILKFVASVGGEDYAVIEYAGEPSQILCRKLSDGSLAGTFSIKNEDRSFAISHINRLENDMFYCLLTS